MAYGHGRNPNSQRALRKHQYRGGGKPGRKHAVAQAIKALVERPPTREEEGELTIDERTGQQLTRAELIAKRGVQMLVTGKTEDGHILSPGEWAKVHQVIKGKTDPFEPDDAPPEDHRLRIEWMAQQDPADVAAWKRVTGGWAKYLETVKGQS